MKKQNTTRNSKSEGGKENRPKTVKKDTAKSVGKYTYENVSAITVNDKIESFIKKENDRVSERMKERGIKLSDVVKVSKYHQKQFQNGKLRSDAIKYTFSMKDESKKVFNFSKFFKIK
jgi:hypothetical protein